MTKQIAVRLPEELVDQIDALIAEGATASRAAFVESALEREFRRRLYEREVEILKAIPVGEDPDGLDALAEWGARQPTGLD
jgi:Arc/MetJ-type ribon-helix-helix transcriptional regulator